MCQFVAFDEDARPRTAIAAAPTVVPPAPDVWPLTPHGPTVPAPFAMPCTPVPSVTALWPLTPMAKPEATEVARPTTAPVLLGPVVWAWTPTALPVVAEFVPNTPTPEAFAVVPCMPCTE